MKSLWTLGEERPIDREKTDLGEVGPAEWRMELKMSRGSHHKADLLLGLVL